MTDISNYRRLSKEAQGMADSILLEDQRDALLKMAGEYDELARKLESHPRWQLAKDRLCRSASNASQVLEP